MSFKECLSPSPEVQIILLSIMEKWTFLVVLWAERRMYTFLQSLRHGDSNNIAHYEFMKKYRPSVKQYVSIVNCET